MDNFFPVSLNSFLSCNTRVQDDMVHHVRVRMWLVLISAAVSTLNVNEIVVCNKKLSRQSETWQKAILKFIDNHHHIIKIYIYAPLYNALKCLYASQQKSILKNEPSNCQYVGFYWSFVSTKKRNIRIASSSEK